MTHSTSPLESASLQAPFARGVLQAVIDSTSAPLRLGLGVLRLPFDAARSTYASCVEAGLIERSILASRDLECGLGALEQWTLGPLARRV